MTKRLLIIFLAIGFSMYTTGCSSSGSADDADIAVSNDEAFAEEGEGDFAEEAADEFSDEFAEAGSDEFSDEFGDEFGGDEFAEGDATGEMPADNGEELSLDDSTAVAGNTEGALEDELSLDDAEPLPEDIAGTFPEETAPLTEEAAPITDEPLFTGEPDAFASEEPLAEGTDVTADSMGSSDSVAMESFDQTDSSSSSDLAMAPIESSGESVGGWIPVKKIKDEAFTRAGANLNRVYIARPGDDIRSISQKIYGSDRSSDLLAWNSHLNRGVDTGDKVYYSSPRDPNDNRILTFYEDVGVAPQVYVSTEGDNIRRVSKELLGSSESWKEIWATNMNVESKGDIPAGLQLRYWPDGAESGAMSLAGNMAPAQPGQPFMPGQEPDVPPMPDAPPNMGGMPPMDGMGGGMPPQDIAGDPMSGGMPPDMNGMGQQSLGSQQFDDPTAGSAAGSIGQPAGDPLAPPPPPMEPLAPPPPPPIAEPNPVAKKPKPVAVGSDMTSDPDSLMAMGFGVILLIAVVVLFVVIRKNRSKRMDLGQTQV